MDVELEWGSWEYVHGRDEEDIKHIDGSQSYSSFFTSSLLHNRPCILRIPDLVEGWGSKRFWVENNKPNLTYLEDKYGTSLVPVADCNEKYFNSQKKSEMTLSNFLKFWAKYSENDYPPDMPVLYLKDWHFIKDYPEENIYQVPKYFASDWLNEYLCDGAHYSDDYRFVYMGPKGSWTPLHVDVFTSFSWSVNICGRKKWLLFPPGEEECLKDKHGQLAYDATSPDLRNNSWFPNYHKLCKSFEITQEAGEAIFVPSNWHHQVWNLEDTISINHNWVNGCNINAVWQSLKDNLTAVKKEVDDCRDMECWDEHCQVMLKATYGMNYEEFHDFLFFIATRRLGLIEEDKQISLFEGWLLGKNHALFDLKQLKEVLHSLLNDADTKSLGSFKTKSCETLNLISRIDMAGFRLECNR